MSTDSEDVSFIAKQVEMAKEESAKVTTVQYILGVVCIVGSAFCCGCVNITFAKLKDIHYSLLVFHYGWISSVVLFIWLLFEFIVWNGEFTEGFRIFTYTGYQWVLLLFIAISNALAMNLLTIAFQNDKSTFVSTMAYMMLVYAFIVDMTIFQIEFKVLELVGSIIILVLSLGTIYIKLRATTAAPTKVQN